jgi:hypothetical protein
VTGREIALTVTSVALVIDLALFARIAFNLYHGLRSKQWPHVMGKITGARVRTWYDTPSHHEAMLNYEYIARGRQYFGSRMVFGRFMCIRFSVAEAAIQYFQKQSQVKVFFHPEDPSLSVLAPGVMPQHYVKAIGLFVMALLLLRFAGWLLFI